MPLWKLSTGNFFHKYCECIVNRHLGMLNVLRVVGCGWVYYSKSFQHALLSVLSYWVSDTCFFNGMTISSQVTRTLLTSYSQVTHKLLTGFGSKSCQNLNLHPNLKIVFWRFLKQAKCISPKLGKLFQIRQHL